MPFFSIIIPSYNRTHVVKRVIDSVLNQYFEDFEIIVVDDGSTDDTKKNVLSIDDKRIIYKYQENKGVCSARNYGAKIALGDYLIFLDSDDFVEKNWLEDFHNEFVSSSCDIVYCNVKMILPNGSIKLIEATNPYGIVKENSVKGTDLTGSWVVKKEAFSLVGMYDENIKFGENNELRLRFKDKKLQIGIVDKYNFIYNASEAGGGKNYHNKLNSILYILDKHKEYYNQNTNSKKRFLFNNP